MLPRLKRDYSQLSSDASDTENTRRVRPRNEQEMIPAANIMDATDISEDNALIKKSNSNDFDSFIENIENDLNSVNTRNPAFSIEKNVHTAENSNKIPSADANSLKLNPLIEDKKESSMTPNANVESPIVFKPVSFIGQQVSAKTLIRNQTSANVTCLKAASMINQNIPIQTAANVTCLKPVSDINQNLSITPNRNQNSANVTSVKPVPMTDQNLSITPNRNQTSADVTSLKPVSMSDQNLSITPNRNQISANATCLKQVSKINQNLSITPNRKQTSSNVASSKSVSMTNQSLSITPSRNQSSANVTSLKPVSMSHQNLSITPNRIQTSANVTSFKPVSMTNQNLSIKPNKNQTSANVTCSKPVSMINQNITTSNRNKTSSNVTSFKTVPMTNQNISTTPNRNQISANVNSLKPVSMTNQNLSITPSRNRTSANITSLKPVSMINQNISMTPNRNQISTNANSLKPVSMTDQKLSIAPNRNQTSANVASFKPGPMTNQNISSTPNRNQISANANSLKPVSMTNQNLSITPNRIQTFADVASSKPVSMINQNVSITPIRNKTSANVTSFKQFPMTNQNLSITLNRKQTSANVASSKSVSMTNQSLSITPSRNQSSANVTSLKPVSMSHQNLSITPNRIQTSANVTSFKPVPMTNQNLSITPNKNQTSANVTCSKPVSMINQNITTSNRNQTSANATCLKQVSMINQNISITPNRSQTSANDTSLKPVPMTKQNLSITPNRNLSSASVTSLKPVSMINQNISTTPNRNQISANANSLKPVPITNQNISKTLNRNQTSANVTSLKPVPMTNQILSTTPNRNQTSANVTSCKPISMTDKKVCLISPNNYLCSNDIVNEKPILNEATIVVKSEPGIENKLNSINQGSPTLIQTNLDSPKTTGSPILGKYLTDDKPIVMKGEPMSDDESMPDVSRYLAGCSNWTNPTLNIDNDRDSLILRINELETDLVRYRMEYGKKEVSASTKYKLSTMILEKSKIIESLKNKLTVMVESKICIYGSDESDNKNEAQEEENVFDYTKGIFDDMLSAFSGPNSVTAQGIHKLQGVLARCPDESEYAEDPIGLTVPLMLHQKKALKWLIFREDERDCPGGILADDMGLGKTLTMISLILRSLPPVGITTTGINTTKKIISIGDRFDSDDEDWNPPSRYGLGKEGYGRNAKYGGTLVVCPPTLLDQWKNEIKNKTQPNLLSVKVHHGNYRSRDPRDLCLVDVVITTYNLMNSDMWIFSSILWQRVVLDEAHYIRNPVRNFSQAACQLKSYKRWAMTGTPVHNRPLDIYSLIKFLRCSPWDDKDVWNKTMKGTRGGMARLTTVLKSLILRRTKEELQANGEMPPMPNKNIETILINLNEEEADVYKTLLVYSQSLFAQFLMKKNQKTGQYDPALVKFLQKTIKDKRKGISDLNQTDFPKEIFEELNKTLMCDKNNVQQYHILVLLVRLRQICDHPALAKKIIDAEEVASQAVEDSKLTENPENMSQEILISKKKDPSETSSLLEKDRQKNPIRSDNPVFNKMYESSKIKLILETVRNIMPSGDKIVIVSQWTSMLDVIEWHLSESGETRYIILSGRVKVQDRQGVVDAFNNPKNDLKILLLSLTAGGVGLNLFGGNHLLMVDNHWNPQLEKQAEDRVYRFGQTKEVFIYKFLCTDTIEERVKELQDFKLKMADDILLRTKLTSTNLTLQDLKHLFSMQN